MPSTIYESTLTDAGSDVMGGTRVIYVAWEVTVEGPTIRRPNGWDDDSIVGVGHWSIGNDLTSLGLISGLGFDAPHWIYRTIGQWIAPPGLVGSSITYAVAQYVRWSISPGTSVHLYVFGDS